MKTDQCFQEIFIEETQRSHSCLSLRTLTGVELLLWKFYCYSPEFFFFFWGGESFRRQKIGSEGKSVTLTSHLQENPDLFVSWPKKSFAIKLPDRFTKANLYCRTEFFANLPAPITNFTTVEVSWTRNSLFNLISSTGRGLMATDPFI